MDVLSGVDLRCSGQWCDLANSVRVVGGCVETGFSLPGEYGLHMRRNSSDPEGAKEIVRDV